MLWSNKINSPFLSHYLTISVTVYLSGNPCLGAPGRTTTLKTCRKIGLENAKIEKIATADTDSFVSRKRVGTCMFFVLFVLCVFLAVFSKRSLCGTSGRANPCVMSPDRALGKNPGTRSAHFGFPARFRDLHSLHFTRQGSCGAGLSFLYGFVTPMPRNRIFVDQNENRDLISRALGAQIPNPGSVRSRAKREIFDFCCDGQGCKPRGSNSYYEGGGYRWLFQGRTETNTSRRTADPDIPPYYQPLNLQTRFVHSLSISREKSGLPRSFAA